MERYIHLVTEPSKRLGISFGNNAVADVVSRSEAQEAPEISFALGSPSSRYILVSLDNDAPYPSFRILSPILHSIQSDLKLTPGAEVLTSEKPYIVEWIGPEPPPGSSPHTYTFLLYEQPPDFHRDDFASFEGNPVGLWQRIRWNLKSWEMKAKVGVPVAVGTFKSN